jgi:hypothetical protein
MVQLGLHQSHLRPNLWKLARHDKRNKQHSKENKPIEFRRCRLALNYFSITIVDVLFPYPRASFLSRT